MRKPTGKDDIQGAVFNKPSKAKKKPQSISLSTGNIDTLEMWVEDLTFDHRIKNASLSEIVEAALNHFFESHDVGDMAKIAKKNRLKDIK